MSSAGSDSHWICARVVRARRGVVASRAERTACRWITRSAARMRKRTGKPVTSSDSHRADLNITGDGLVAHRAS